MTTVCTATPSMGGPKAPFLAEELSLPMESNDPQGADEEVPLLIIALDHGIENDGDVRMMAPWDHFRRGCHHSGIQTWSFKHSTP